MKSQFLLLSFLCLLAGNLFANSECPEYNPPQTSTVNQIYYTSNSCSGQPKFTSPGADACMTTVPCIPGMYGTNIQFVSYTSSPNQCTFKSSSVPNGFGYGGLMTSYDCEPGYTKINNVCTLTDASKVQCPPPVCTSGDSQGFGPATTTLVCANRCAVKPKGMTAAELDNSGNQIGVKLTEWVNTGQACTAVVPTPPAAPNINKANTNCITNGTRQLCLSTQKPGCGSIDEGNGPREWCPDQVGCGLINGKRICVNDNSGGCGQIGFGSYFCIKGALPPSPPANEPPPVVDFKGSVPVQNGLAPTGGTPTTGAMPKSDGSDLGGSTPFIAGHYPGNSGNGTGMNPKNPDSPNNPANNGSGSGNIDTSGLAQESSLQSLGGLITQIRDSLGGSVSGSGFTATTLGTHSNVNISPDITAKQTELSTKLAQVKAEFGQLLSFGSSTNAQALQCPANSGFTFYGTTISLCTQSVLSATATIGNVLIFLAFVVSLFILLS